MADVSHFDITDQTHTLTLSPSDELHVMVLLSNRIIVDVTQPAAEQLNSRQIKIGVTRPYSISSYGQLSFKQLVRVLA